MTKFSGNVFQFYFTLLFNIPLTTLMINLHFNFGTEAVQGNRFMSKPATLNRIICYLRRNGQTTGLSLWV